MKKLTAFVLAALILLAIGCTSANDNNHANEAQPTAAVSTPTEKPISDHDRAMALLESGDFEAAYALLEQIGDVETIAANKYDRAQALIETGDYEAAYTLLDGLNYQDSAELLSDVKFQMQKTNISTAEKGDIITFGAYEQDNDLSNGKEDIEWIVLAKNNDKLLVVSKYVLDCQAYNSTEEGVSWMDCSLRKWLNDDFYNAAFSVDQQEMVAVSNAKGISTVGSDPVFDESVDEIESDKIFVLGLYQVDIYFQTYAQKQCQATAYAKALGACQDDSGYGTWLIKSYLLRETFYLHFISKTGELRSKKFDEASGIRPAMWINTEPTAASEALAASKYENAVSLIEAGDYKAAYAVLNGLNYKDSSILLANIKSTLLASAKVGEFVNFGTYEQDGDTSNGKEEIEWLVLDKEDDKVLVISRFALDYQPYNTTETSSITWETCSLRAWLNDTFLNNAFNPEEQACIVETTLQTEIFKAFSDYSEGSDGNATTDTVFLLDYTEANKYFKSNAERLCELTPYMTELTSTGCYIGFEHPFAFWWLRTTLEGYVNAEAALASYELGDNPVDWKRGIRPAMWIKIDPTAAKEETPQPETEITEITIDAMLIGTWQDASLDKWYSFEFREDGTGTYTSGSFVLDFTYTVQDGKIHFQYAGYVSESIRPYQIMGGLNLKITDVYGYSAPLIKLIKQ